MRFLAAYVRSLIRRQQPIMPSPGLLDMPAEMLGHILSQLDVRCDRKALYDICLCSRVLRSFARPILFRHFHFPNNGALDEAYKRDCMVRLVQFTRTCIRNPKLAAAVLEIDLDTGAATLSEVMPFMDAEDFEVFGWQSKCEDNQFFCLMVLLISHLSNLTTVIIASTEVHEPITSTALQKVTEDLKNAALPRKSPPIRNLELVTYFPTDGLFNVAQISIIIALPTLQTFAATCWQVWEGALTYPEIFCPPPASSNVTNLELHNCFMSAMQLQIFMKSFRCLRSFIYEVDGLDQFDNHATPEEIRLALESQARFLQYLDIDLDGCTYDGDLGDVTDEDGMFLADPDKYLGTGSLHRFESLKYPKMESGRLGDLSNLPPNIESIMLVDDCVYDTGFYEQLLGLKQALPALGEVTVCCDNEGAAGMSEFVAKAGGTREEIAEVATSCCYPNSIMCHSHVISVVTVTHSFITGSMTSSCPDSSKSGRHYGPRC
ncbi:hypothetical protein BDV96DRAFT_630225 [Lophiotrema nucula]|uniref:F-box domain-containing protein n=1 Tax=Lophiotrema nucula TaxID=690887 RepID=A0A6A5ZEM0_9PLEO|nr:hypothetical protein BDV96DRAFT_630225 [Lophiotrema nucula]